MGVPVGVAIVVPCGVSMGVAVVLPVGESIGVAVQSWKKLKETRKNLSS